MHRNLDFFWMVIVMTDMLNVREDDDLFGGIADGETDGLLGCAGEGVAESCESYYCYDCSEGESCCLANGEFKDASRWNELFDGVHRRLFSAVRDKFCALSCFQVPLACSFSDDERILYALMFTPDAVLSNPMSSFKTRAAAGDFNPLTEEEERLCELPSYREPMDEAEFEARKQQVIRMGAYWDGKPEVTVFELFQNVVHMVQSLFMAGDGLDRMP